MKYLIIGNCIAAAAAVEGIRNVDQQGDITIIDGEERGSYTRPLITYYLAGTRTPSELLYRPANFFSINQVRVVAGWAACIHPKIRTVVLENGEHLKYDRLLLATGASSVIPNLPGIQQSWVKTLYTWRDAEEIDQLIKLGKTAVILGSGLIGLKAAEALLKRDMKVAVIEKQLQILPRLLSPASAQMLAQHLENKGIRVLVGREARSILGQQQIELDNGLLIDAQLVIVAVGTSPNLSLALGCGLETGKGIRVDSQLRTSDPFIYAAGDVIETKDIISGDPQVMALLPHAHREGYLAGRNMAGRLAGYSGGIFLNAVSIMGLNIFAAGSPQAIGNTLYWQDRERYLEMIFDREHLNRYISFNMPEVTGPLTTIVESRMQIPEADWLDFINQPSISTLPSGYWEEIRR